MNSKREIAVIGGDARMVSAAEHLAHSGWTVKVWGLSSSPHDAMICDTPEEALQNVSFLLLPIPMTRDHLQISGTDLTLLSLGALLREGMTVFCGMPDEDFAELAQQRGAAVVDYSRDEVFMIRNALPTAEGAVAIAMNELRRTLYASRALVIGYGRIGKLLADLLVRLGADVTVAARKSTDRATAELHGCQSLPISRQNGDEYILSVPTRSYHVIFNTVPVPLMDDHILRTLDGDTVLIDLASAPGGIDYDAANRRGLKTVVALSLPGKVAPITAGEIIGDYILTYQKGGGILP